MLPIISTVVVALAAALVIRVVTRPDSFRVERSVRIDAPPEKVYALLEDFREWPRWSPWEQLDPSLQRTYSGAEKGEGATYSWSGNRKAGEGRMEIVEAEHPRHIGLEIVFLKPFRAENRIDFMLTPAGAETEVSWTMQGQSSLSNKVMQAVMDMDGLVGRDFERGLAKLKTESEDRTAHGAPSPS